VPRIRRTFGKVELDNGKTVEQRPSSSDRGYDRTWRKFAAHWLTQEPLCRMCKARGYITPGVLVDHIVPLRAGGARLSRDNVQSLCRSCHTLKTNEDAKRWPMDGREAR
jgi:5-methylcytosine-specific restriction endonuclease McrA